jgi:hypothetical protein
MPQPKEQRAIDALRDLGGDEQAGRNLLNTYQHKDQLLSEPDGHNKGLFQNQDKRDQLRAAHLAYAIYLSARGKNVGDALRQNNRRVIERLHTYEIQPFVQLLAPARSNAQFTQHLYRSEDKRQGKLPLFEQWAQVNGQAITQANLILTKAAGLDHVEDEARTTETSLRDNAMVLTMFQQSLQPGGFMGMGNEDRLVLIRDEQDVVQAACIYERLEYEHALKVHYLVSAPWNIFNPEPRRHRRVKGAGTFALTDAIRRTDQVESTRGKIKLDAMTDNVVAFYERFGFQRIHGEMDSVGNHPMELVTVNGH